MSLKAGRAAAEVHSRHAQKDAAGYFTLRAAPLIRQHTHMMANAHRPCNRKILLR